MPFVDRNGNFCGLLEEEEKEGQWQTKFFVLNQADNVLEAFTDTPENLLPGTPPCRTINMHCVSLVTDAAKTKPKVQHCFCMTVSGKKLYFAARSKEDQKEWMSTLQNACRIMTVAERSIRRRSSGEGSYKTRIVGGVVQKIPIDESSSEEEMEFDMDSDSDDGSFRKRGRPTLDPIKVGYCVKQGFVRKSWKRRYFVLDEDGISYYKDAPERVPIKTLHKGEIIEARKSIGVHPTKDNVFELVTAKRVFYVQAPDKDEMEHWIQAISEILVNKKGSKEFETPASSCNTFPRQGQKREISVQTSATLERKAMSDLLPDHEPEPYAFMWVAGEDEFSVL